VVPVVVLIIVEVSMISVLGDGCGGEVLVVPVTRLNSFLYDVHFLLFYS
jgi:hypothetical protein